MDFATRLEEVLRSSFPEAEVRVHADSADRAFAVVVWEGFSHQPDRVRQQSVWGQLARLLTPPERQKVSLILTSTPEEDELLRDFPPDRD